MSRNEIGRLLALIVVFSTILALDAIFSGMIAAHLDRIFKPFLSLSLKSRVFFTQVVSGIKLAMGRNVFDSISIGEEFTASGGIVLGIRDEYIIVAAPSKPGDVAVDPKSKRIVGISRQSHGKISWVESVFSPNISIPVVVRSNEVSVDGELLCGNRLRTYEDIDVTGFEVYISDAFTCGTILRNLGYGFIGTVVGIEGRYYLLDNVFTTPDSVLFLPCY